MALRASELLLIVRAQNQASGALRRIAGDLRGLSSVGGLQARGKALQVARNQIMLQRQISKNELESIENGKRSIAMQRAYAGNQLTMMHQARQRAGIDQAYRRNQEAVLANEARTMKLQAQQARLAEKGITGTPWIVNQKNLKQAAIAAERLRFEHGRLGQQVSIADAAMAKQVLTTQELDARQAQLSSRASVLRQRIANYGDRLKLNTTEILANNKAISAARWDRVGAGGRILQHTGRLLNMFGIVAGATLGYAALKATQFSTSITLAATQTREIGHSFVQTAKNSDYLQKRILGLMTQFPATADEMSKSAYDIYSSLNISLPGGIRLLKLFNQAAVAGQTGLDEVTQAGITVMNNFRIKVPQATKAFQKMFAAVRFGRMTFAEFVKMMPQLSPAFAAAGYGLTEMAQAAAFMTRVMPNTARAATSLARLTEIMGRKDFVTGAKAAGVTITDLHNRLLPLPEIIDRLAKKFPEIAKAIKSGRGDVALQNFFKTITALGSATGKGGTMGTIQARRAFTFFVTQSKLAHQVYGQVARDQNEFTQALRAMEKTTGVRWGVFVNQLKALGLAIGSQVVPALLKMEGPIRRMVKWWQNLDDATKRTVTRWATYASIAAILAGGIGLIGGAVVRLFALFGRLFGFMTGLGAIFTTVGLAAAALTGHIKALSDILDVIVNFGTGSFAGWAITMGIAASAAVRLSSALKGAAAAEGAVAGGGILAGLLGRGRAGARAFSIGRQAAGLRVGLMSAVGAAGLLTGSLGLAVGTIALGSAGLFLWKRHMDSAKKAADQVAEALDRARRVASIPTSGAKLLGGIGGPATEAERQAINIRTITRSIADLQKQLATAPRGERAGIRDQIRGLQLDLIDARRGMRQNYADISKDFAGFTASFAGQARNMRAIAGGEIRLEGLLKLRDAFKRGGIAGVGVLTQDFKDLARTLGVPMNAGLAAVNERIKATSASLEIFRQKSQEGAVALRTNFNRAVRDLAEVYMPKIKLTPNMLRDMFSVALQKRRMITIPEMKLIAKAELDKRSISKMPAILQRQFRAAVKIRVTLDAKDAAFQKSVRNLTLFGAKPFSKFKVKPDVDTKGIQSKFNILKTPIEKPVRIKLPDLRAIGGAISTGIQLGMTPVSQTVITTVIKRPFQEGLQTHSPSKWMARNVGAPIMQGIIQGILSERGELQKTAMITANIFAGGVIEEAESKKRKITAALLTKDLEAQRNQYFKFNNALARLARRGAPKELIDQLAALGPEAADKIAQLSRMSKPQLDKYIRIWKQTQNEIKRSMRSTQEEIKSAQSSFIDDLVSRIRDMYNDIKSTVREQFGDLFAGPMNLSEMTGENYQNALKDYQSSVADYQGQLADLYKQLGETQAEAGQRLADAIKQRMDELQGLFGQLFSGEWLSGVEVQTKIEWGQKLGFDDLQKDLDSQVNRFKRWRELLVSLAAKVPPELAKQLEDLGPEAVDKLEILNSGTNDQLTKYISTWKEGQQAIAGVANQTTVDTSDITARVNEILGQIAQVTQKLSELQMPHQLTGADIIADLRGQIDAWFQYQDVLQTLIDRGLPAELIQQLRALGPQALPYLIALAGMTDTQLAEYVKLWEEKEKAISDSTLKMLNEQLRLWYEYGRKIALNIIAGIDSQSQKLEKYFREIILSILKGMNWPPPPITPPNTNDDRDDSLKIKPGGTVTPVGPGTTGTGRGTGVTAYQNPNGNNPVVNMVVNAYADESLDSVLARAAFRLTTKVPG